MPINLNAPLEWKKADTAILDDLQGNILKGHGRDNTINLFLQFDASKAAQARTFVKELAKKVTSSRKQLEDSERFKASNGQISGETFVAFFLSFEGYRALEINQARTPTDPSFTAGLKARSGILNDPPVTKWDKHFRNPIHAMVLIAENDKVKREQMQADLLALLNPAVKLVGTEIGLAMRNTSNDGIEHFGYVDGRSQPLLLKEDIEKEKDTTDGTHVWNPAFPVGQAVVACPGGTAGVSFGSYFVFRKLEQNVKAFKESELKIAVDVLKLQKKDRELGGAMLVGRFEDGTPVVLHAQNGADNPVPNDFTYESDTKGLKCPFHAHIRKTNPRGESVGTFAASLEEERSHIMARRGITYGERVWENGAVNTVLDEDHLPKKDVGLLFMAYQNNIGNQFEFTQRFWANNEGFVKSDPSGKPLTGLDPIIGQGAPTIQLTQTRQWGKDDKKKFNFNGFVTMKGGEYFFAPCISFLKSL